MKKDPKFYLSHILESIEKIELSTSGLTKDEFVANSVIQDAVIRRLEIIGEATKNIPQSLKASYPYVEWRKVAGLRDVIVHEYFGISINLIWGIINKDIPNLKKQISKIYGELISK